MCDRINGGTRHRASSRAPELAVTLVPSTTAQANAGPPGVERGRGHERLGRRKLGVLAVALAAAALVYAVM
jgi:hypothetical protein